MHSKLRLKTVDDYISLQPPDTQVTLRALRRIILKVVPTAVEMVNYNIPAYALIAGGKRDKQIMIAGYKTFVGFYPGSGILDNFSKPLKSFKYSKGAVQFPNNYPLPEELIVRIIKFKLKIIRLQGE